MVNIVLNVKWRNVAWVWVGLVCLVMGVWVVGQWVVGDISFRKMYGLYGLKHHIVEMSGDVMAQRALQLEVGGLKGP